MSLMNVTAESLSKQLEIEVPEIYVLVAKHSVMGMDRESMCEILGCELADIVEVEANQEYRLVRAAVASVHSQMLVTQTAGWDAIEDMAMTNLLKRLPYEKDSEFLLKVAAVANRANRRLGVKDNVLDPSKVNGRTAITLTQRLVRKLQRGDETVEETRQISIHDGSMGRASFNEVDSLLSVTSQPVLSKPMEIRTQIADPKLEDLDRLMEDRYG